MKFELIESIGEFRSKQAQDLVYPTDYAAPLAKRTWRALDVDGNEIYQVTLEEKAVSKKLQSYLIFRYTTLSFNDGEIQLKAMLEKAQSIYIQGIDINYDYSFDNPSHQITPGGCKLIIDLTVIRERHLLSAFDILKSSSLFQFDDDLIRQIDNLMCKNIITPDETRILDEIKALIAQGAYEQAVSYAQDIVEKQSSKERNEYNYLFETGCLLCEIIEPTAQLQSYKAFKSVATDEKGFNFAIIAIAEDKIRAIVTSEIARPNLTVKEQSYWIAEFIKISAMFEEPEFLYKALESLQLNEVTKELQLKHADTTDFADIFTDVIIVLANRCRQQDAELAKMKVRRGDELTFTYSAQLAKSTEAVEKDALQVVEVSTSPKL